MDDATLLEQVRAAEARLALLAPDSAFSDAAAALCARLAETRAHEAEVTHKVTLPDPWRRAVFIALGRRYGLHLHRHAGQRRQTLMVCVPPSFFSRVLWPEFERITDLLMNRFDAITQELLRALAPSGDNTRHLVLDGDLGPKRDDCHGTSYGTLMGTTNGTPTGTAKGTPAGTANGTLRDPLGALLGVLLTSLLAALALARRLARAGPLRHAFPEPCCDDLTADFTPAEEVAPMTAARTAMDRLQEMVRLHRLGHGPKHVARMLKMSPKTERAYRAAFRAEGIHDGDPEVLADLDLLRAAVEKHRPTVELPHQQRSRIEDWRDDVRALLDKAIGPRAIFDRLRLGEPPYTGSYAQIKRLCRSLRRDDGPRAEDVAIPVVTSPGQVAQVDFGYVGKLRDPRTGERRDAWVFVMVLAHSRRIVARVVFDQRADTWARLHVEAFEELGAVPATIVPDNLKAAVVRAAFAVSGAPSELHRGYRSLAQHYGFAIDPTPPRDPRKKGKVESGVKYTKRSCFAPLTAAEREDFAGVTRHLARWCVEVANARVHGTTGKVPAEAFEAEERGALKPLPPTRFDPITWRHAKVHQDAHVVFEGRMYSVPWRLIGKEVWIAATTATVAVWCDDTRVATHARRGEGSHATNEAHLPEFRRDLRHRDPAYWTTRADAIGPEVGAYVREVFASDRVLSQLRVVQALVMLLERVPAERARAAATRASYFANYRLGEMQRILSEGLERLPLPNAVAPAADGTLAPRFARSITELLHAEVSGECH